MPYQVFLSNNLHHGGSSADKCINCKKRSKPNFHFQHHRSDSLLSNMFYLIKMTRDIVMQPSSFGPGLHDEIRMRLKRDVEGTTDGKYGFIIMVDEIYPIERGLVLEGGGATFDVTFRVVVFRPFKHEVIDAIVTGIDSIGFRCEAGPLKIIVTKEV